MALTSEQRAALAQLQNLTPEDARAAARLLESSGLHEAIYKQGAAGGRREGLRRAALLKLRYEYGVDPDYAEGLLSKEEGRRMKPQEDGTVKLYQTDGQTPYAPGEQAFDRFVRDTARQVPPKFIEKAADGSNVALSREDALDAKKYRAAKQAANEKGFPAPQIVG